jgi:putative ABC transport system substrate-binding protein
MMLLALAIPLLSGCGEVQQKTYRIGISQILTHPALDATREGIIDALAIVGYLDEDTECPAGVERKTVEYDYQNSEGDMTLVASIAQKFVDANMDIIVSIATPNSISAVQAAKDTEIPVVFSAVTDPVAAKLITDWYDHPDENVTGVSDMINVKSILELMLEIDPGIKTVGTVYNAGEENSVVLTAALKKACEELGLEVVERTVATSADVQASSQSLVGQVDAIWIGTDNTVVSGLEALVKVCEDNQIPLFPSDDASVERGGIATLGFDYYDLGFQTGEMIVRIIEGEKASEIPVELGEKFYYTVNVEAAEKYGITIPQSIIDSAENVYGK